MQLELFEQPPEFASIELIKERLLARGKLMNECDVRGYHISSGTGFYLRGWEINDICRHCGLMYKRSPTAEESERYNQMRNMEFTI
jgi:hypothetical protein